MRGRARSYVAVFTLASSLVDVDNVIGIDTDSGRSMSTKKGDFIYVDTSEKAKRSVIITGAGGGMNRVGGIGTMVIYAVNECGEPVAKDPSAMWILPGDDQPHFRVVGQI